MIGGPEFDYIIKEAEKDCSMSNKHATFLSQKCVWLTEAGCTVEKAIKGVLLVEVPNREVSK